MALHQASVGKNQWYKEKIALYLNGSSFNGLSKDLRFVAINLAEKKSSKNKCKTDYLS